MGEFLQKNKLKVLRLVFLVLVFFVIVAYINGRSIYKERVNQLENKSFEVKAK
jgi:hypothetical protein